jgi:hypothetical protein
MVKYIYMKHIIKYHTLKSKVRVNNKPRVVTLG